MSGKRAVLYARVSGDDRSKEGRNLDGQLKMCREYALSKGYEIVAELAEDDRGAKGASFDLEKLNQALKMAEESKFDVLVVRELDRFARSLAKQLIIENTFKQRGVEVEYVLAEYDDTPEGQLQKHVRAVIAEYEKEKIAERTTRGRFNFVRRGNVLGHGKAPFGYKLVDESGTRQLVVEEAEAHTVRLIFDLYVQDRMTIRGIAKKLTGMGIPTANDLRKRHKLNGYAVWSPGSLQHILNNETYAGVWHYGKARYHDGRFVKNGADHRVSVQVPAIIERAVWEEAQRRREENRRFPNNRRKYDYLLSGRVACGGCGLAMAGRTVKNNGKLYQYYFCPAKTDHSPRECSSPYFPCKRVDAVVWSWLKEWLCDPEQLANGLAAYQADQAQSLAPLFDRLKTVEDMILSNQTQLERLLDLYLAGDFPQELLVERKARIETTLQALEEEESKLRTALTNERLSEDQVTSIVEFSKVIQEGLAKANDDYDTKRSIVELLDVRVTLAIEEGQKVVYASCRLGEERLSVVTTTN